MANLSVGALRGRNSRFVVDQNFQVQIECQIWSVGGRPASGRQGGQLTARGSQDPRSLWFCSRQNPVTLVVIFCILIFGSILALGSNFRSIHSFLGTGMGPKSHTPILGLRNHRSPRFCLRQNPVTPSTPIGPSALNLDVGVGSIILCGGTGGPRTPEHIHIYGTGGPRTPGHIHIDGTGGPRTPGHIHLHWGGDPRTPLYTYLGAAAAPWLVRPFLRPPP